jgi:cytochrome c oxidase subunit 2
MRKSRRKLLAGAASLVSLALVGGYAVAQAPRVIRVSAKKFIFTPDKIALTRGEPVVFELSSEDVLMGFSLPDFNLRTDIVPGKTVQLAFTPDKAGEFDFICDVFCGDLHEDMNGKIIVT